jgi:hypothetical protein
VVTTTAVGSSAVAALPSAHERPIFSTAAADCAAMGLDLTGRPGPPAPPRLATDPPTHCSDWLALRALRCSSTPIRIGSIYTGEPGKYDSLTGYNITIGYLAYDPQIPCPSSAVTQVQVHTVAPKPAALIGAGTPPEPVGTDTIQY